MDRELKNLTLNISQLAALSGVHRQTAAARLQNLPVAGGHESNLKLYRVVDIVSAFLALPPPVAEGEMDAHERKAWYQSERERLKFEQETAQLIPASDVRREFAIWAKAVVQVLETLPDMRGWTIKGKPASGRAVLSQEQDGIKSHTHSASASSTDLGTKTTSSFDYGTKSTNNTGAHTHSVSGTAASAGAHTHSMTFVSGGSSGAPGSGSPDYSKYSVNTSSAGAHTHSVSGTAASAGAHAHTVGIGAHTHSVAIGSHGHTITVNAAGNAENTVKNIAFNYIVRLA
ncbi:TPA: DUF1441 family protein [Escherichia coli]|nr:DUF1441 family protein [Escherichia coli]